jgi:2-C-methyl-D-erythritol 4-phosphate cytidylyltransferase
MACCAILVAAGSSRRMGFDKLAAPLAGKPVLRRTLEAFLGSDAIDSVVVVAPEERFAPFLKDHFAKPVIRADGGRDRQDSVRNGLAAVPAHCDLVAVHDGARPLVSDQDILQCLEDARRYGAAALARPVTETLKRADAEGFARENVDRELLWFMETPQVFKKSLLQEACAAVLEHGLVTTDEVSALQAIGYPVKLVASLAPNPKITHPSDLDLAEALLRA